MRPLHALALVLSFALLAGCGRSSPGTPYDGGPTPLPDGGTCVPRSGAPALGGCPLFPTDNEWNRDVSCDPVDEHAADYLASMNASSVLLHADFGSNPAYGIPYVLVTGSQARVPMSFDYADQSDPGPYPFPPDAPIEGGAASTGDRHVLVVDTSACVLYEAYDAHFLNPGWHCGSGARFELRSNALRPDGWTSADAAGLPILAGLVRYEEAMSGEIQHAIRMTVRSTQRAFVHPATHFASSDTSAARPPMGLRVRLRATFDVSGFHGASLAVVRAMKRYGMIVADNGSDWHFTGVTDTRWDDPDLEQLKRVPASAFEVIKLGAIHR